MYDICHPSYYKIGELGCQDDSKITTAFYVYIELCEVRKLWDVEYKYNPMIDTIYLTAKTSKNAKIQLYVPWPVKDNINLHEIEKIQNHLNCKRITLVLKSGESSSIFYVVSKGLRKPTALQRTKKLRFLNQKTIQLNKELKRNSRNLYGIAQVRISKNDAVSTEMSHPFVENN